VRRNGLSDSRARKYRTAENIILKVRNRRIQRLFPGSILASAAGDDNEQGENGDAVHDQRPLHLSFQPPSPASLNARMKTKSAFSFTSFGCAFTNL
jgi:hypothetical protein